MKIMLLAIRRETVHRKRWTFYALFGEERRDMMEKMLKKPDYAKEILAIMHGSFSKEEMLDRIADYHENDIAEKKLVPDVWAGTDCGDFFVY